LERQKTWWWIMVDDLVEWIEMMRWYWDDEMMLRWYWDDVEMILSELTWYWDEKVIKMMKEHEHE